MKTRKAWAAALGVVLLAVAAVFVAGALAGTPKAGADDPVVLQVEHNGTVVRSYTQSQLAALGTYSGYAGILNNANVVTGPDPVQGVKLSVVLADAFGAQGVTAQQTLYVYSPSPDPYSQKVSNDQLYSASPRNCTMYDGTTKQQVTSLPGTLSTVLVWSENNQALPSDEGPLRFYVADSQNDNAVMVGSESVFDVTALNVKDEVLPPWNLKLVGLKIHGHKPTDTIDDNSFLSCSAQGCHGAAFKTAAGQRWTGVPLYMLMGQVDGGKDMTYNAALARKGYRIRIYSSNGRTVTISSKATVRRSSIIVANDLNGVDLSSLYYPLRLVGPKKYISVSKYLGRITKIVMLPALK